MSDEQQELQFEDLGLTKSLDKMTAKELRQLVMDKIPMITGASGMDKEALVKAIRDVFGFTEEKGQVSPYKKQISATKKEIRSLREQKAQAEARKDKEALRKKINKLKKRTRRLARAV